MAGRRVHAPPGRIAFVLFGFDGLFSAMKGCCTWIFDAGFAEELTPNQVFYAIIEKTAEAGGCSGRRMFLRGRQVCACTRAKGVSMRIDIPDYAAEVLQRLNDSGFSAFVVGGCLRDILLGRRPGDWDICTSALPEESRACFADKQIVDTGARHGTIGVVFGKAICVEVTTYRIDGRYIDGRHPQQVTFTRDLYRDLARRDFTMNAIAWHPKTGFVDPFGGRQAICEKRISTVGDPRRRFAEDALRILRGLRFASVLGFSLEPETIRGMEEGKKGLTRISAERIQAEFSRLLLGSQADPVLCDFAAILREAIPDLQPVKVSGLPPELSLRLAALFPERTEEALRRLRYDRETIRTAAALARLNREKPPADRREIQKWLRREGRHTMELYMAARGRTRELQDIFDSGACWSLRQLAVSGRDLIESGIPPGAQIGRILERLLDSVIEGKAENRREALLSMVVEFETELQEETGERGKRQ